MLHILPSLPLDPKPTTSPVFKSCGQFSKSCQKFDVVLENKVIYKMTFSKNVNYSSLNFFKKDSYDF